ncbi:putative transcription regulator A20-like family [Helianthus debilis subsp. tardiflorus]
MAEEHKCQQPSTHVLCANNCGFFGSPTTLNLCSKCYKDHCLKDRHISTAKIALTRQAESSSSSRAAVADVAGVPNLVSPVQSLPNPTTTDLTVPSVVIGRLIWSRLGGALIGVNRVGAPFFKSEACEKFELMCSCVY